MTEGVNLLHPKTVTVIGNFRKFVVPAIIRLNRKYSKAKDNAERNNHHTPICYKGMRILLLSHIIKKSQLLLPKTYKDCIGFANKKIVLVSIPHGLHPE